MDSKKFVGDLVLQYKAKNDDERNRVFYEALNTFAEACPENNLQDVFNFITEKHTFSTPFMVGKIWTYAKEKGYIVKSLNKKKDYVLFYSCKGFSQVREVELENGKIIKEYDQIKCNTRYSFKSTGCPNCHSTSSEVVKYESETLPEDVLIVKEDCHKCQNYDLSHSVNVDNQVLGPECDKYAQAEYPNLLCGDCKCALCCESYRDYISDPKKFTDEIKRTGTDPMYWIGKNLVVMMHIRDEERLEAPKRKGSEHAIPSFFGVNIEELAKSKRVSWSK